MSALFSIAFALLFLTSLAAASAAQEIPGSHFAATLEAWRFSRETLPGVALRYNHLNPGGVGLEVGFTTFPQYFDDGATVVGIDLGATGGSIRPGSAIFFKAGPTALVAGSGSGGGAALGLFAGLGAMAYGDGPVGLRLDLTGRTFGYGLGFSGGIGVSFRSTPRSSAVRAPRPPVVGLLICTPRRPTVGASPLLTGSDRCPSRRW